jgi:hypothetical protein
MDVRRADAAFQRFAIAVLVVGTCVGVVLIGIADRYRGVLADWVRADAGQSTQRIGLIFGVFAVLLVAPLVAMAAYLSSLGRRTVLSGEYPPPGSRVIRDTPIARGSEAFSRGRVLQGVAVFPCAAAVVIGLLLWRLASLFSARMG